jgi:hypothetical protein
MYLRVGRSVFVDRDFAGGPLLARLYLRLSNAWRDHVPEISFATMISRCGAGPMACVG